MFGFIAWVVAFVVVASVMLFEKPERRQRFLRRIKLCRCDLSEDDERHDDSIRRKRKDCLQAREAQIRKFLEVELLRNSKILTGADIEKFQLNRVGAVENQPEGETTGQTEEEGNEPIVQTEATTEVIRESKTDDKQIAVHSADDEVLPTDEETGHSDGEVCAICASPFELNDTICWSSNDKCPHVFHKDCILQWFCTCGKKDVIRRREQRQRERAGVEVVDLSYRGIKKFPTECPCCRQTFISNYADNPDTIICEP